ncbi:MAG: ATP-binding protein [Gemmatimonadota bacterium]
MTPRLSRTAAGLVAAITVAVAAASAGGAYLYSRHHFDTLLGVVRENALAQGEVIREALVHQMLRNDRVLIAEMVRGFGGRSDVESLEVLDHKGQIWYASDPGAEGTILSSGSPECEGCHQYSPADRTTSQILDTGDKSLLRVVVPLENSLACHPCHDPAESVNGILILDSDVGGMRRSMNRDLWWMVGGSAGVAFLLVGAVIGIVQVFVLRRLERFETAASLIAGGDLDRRVPAEGSDTISWLGREFNSMADSVTGLLREVRHQRERLETVINSIDDGIVVLDPQRRIVAANTSFLSRTGHGREEVLGCSCNNLTSGGCDTTDCPTLACLDTGRHQVRLCQRRDHSGSTAWEEVHSSPVYGPGGEIVQVVEVWRDISERRGAEARLAESHRLASLGMLASGFSHEMNTPLATTLACVEGILREVRADDGPDSRADRIGETATIARDQILRCKGITQHFLRLSRGQSSPGDMVDVGTVVEAVTRLVEPTAQTRGVMVSVGPIPANLQVRADESDLQHALINLLINAIEACQGEGEVGVHVDLSDSVRVRVSDNGRGIPSVELERIFEPFVSLREGGTGLGLFLALNFVRQWGGDILVKSTPDHGSAFEIVLPPAGQTHPAEVLS